MSSKGAATLVLLTGGLLVGYALLDARAGGVSSETTYKRIYSSFLATVALGVAADFVPQIVAPVCVLVLSAAWARHKGSLGGIISGTATASPQAPAGPVGPVGASSPQAPAGPTGPIG